MNFIKNSFFLIIVLLISSFSSLSFADIGEFDDVCAYTDDNRVITTLKQTADNNNYRILGEPANEESETLIKDVDSRCVDLVLNDGLNCRLSNGELDNSRFYISIGGSNLPQRSICEYESCSGDSCEWYGDSSSDDAQPDDTNTTAEEDDSTPTTVINIGEEETFEDVDLGSVGLQPFDEVDRSVCETPNSPYGGVFMSKQSCEQRDSDCAYDPYRIGVLTQLEGDSKSEGIFSTLREDSMCVSKSTRIKSCEDIRSQQLCQNYESLNPSNDSLMGEYGCEWRDVKSDLGICMTSSLYYENQADLENGENDKIFNVSSSLKRKNFIKNPLFEVNDGSELHYWEGEYQILDNSEYGDILGTHRIRLDSGDTISQLVSGIPFNLAFEVKIITTQGSDIVPIIDSQRVINPSTQPLFESDTYSSDLIINSYEFNNNIEYANRNISFRANSQSEILAVSINLRESDSSSTLNSLTSNIFIEEMFEQNTFNCKLCSLGFNTGNCNEDKIKSLSNCELVSTSSNSPYKSTPHDSSNPYTTYTGFENRFVEEDMTFCGLYTKQETCENPNSKLNSVISAYHNSDTLCKWRSDSSLTNGGLCYKDSLGDDVPDTVERGELSYTKDYVDSQTFFDKYDIGEYNDTSSLNDFQRSCDVLPPQVVIEPYKKVVENGELITKRVNSDSLDELGVIDFYYVRIENYVSPGCGVFENFESNVELVMESDELGSLSLPASDFFLEYNDSLFFQRVYSNSEFTQLLENYVYNTEEFKENGKINVFDTSGNMQKSEIGLNGGDSLDRLEINFSVVPQSTQEVYQFSKIQLQDLNSQMSTYGDSCDVRVIDSDEGNQIIDEKNISVSNLLNEGFNIGSQIKDYESNRVSNEDDEREEFELLLEVTCRDVYERETSKLKNYNFINSDGIIVHSFDNGIFNPDNVPYLDIQTQAMFLNISAREDVSCTNSYVAQNGDKISDLGLIDFSDSSSIEDFPQRYTQDIDFSSFVSSDGIYDYVLECELEGESFERVLDFEYNTQVPDMSSVKLIERDESKWTKFNGNVYVDAVDENLLIGDTNQVETDDFNNYLRTKTEMMFENNSEISKVTMCNSDGIEIFTNNPIINGNIINVLDPTGCEVNYIEEESLIELTSTIILTNTIGNTNSGELVTYFDVKGPNIDLKTQSGGTTQGDTIYFNNNNPVFVVDLGLSDFRDFSCNVDLDVNSNTFSQNFSSSNGEILFIVGDITNQDVLSIPNVNLEFDLNCQDELFGREDSLEVSLQQDFDRPEILDINFVDINKNWGVPLAGNSFTVTSDVEIDIADSEEFISCDYGVINENPQDVIDSKDLKSIDGTNTNRISVDNESIIKKQNTGPVSLLTVSNSPSANNMGFSVRVDCVDGAGNSDSKVFDNYELNLFNYGEIQASGSSSENNNLQLEIRSLSPLSGLNLKIKHGGNEESFYSGSISALSPTFSQEGGVYVTTIDNAGSLEDLPTTQNYPFSIEIPYGDNSFEDEFSVLIDNEDPQISLTDNSNDNGVIFGDILTGELNIIDEPDFSKGLSLVEVELMDQNSQQINLTQASENLGTQDRRNIYFDNLTPGVYQLRVRAVDGSGNEKEEYFVYNMSDQFGVDLLNSDNVIVQDSYPLTWFTQDTNPVLRFETGREVENCYLSPGDNGGYIGSRYDFENTQGNRYELNTQDLSNFEILSGKNKVIIGCERLDRNNEIDEVGVFLHSINGVPDYVLESEWGRTLFIPPGENERLINLDIVQKGQFREVDCELNIQETNSNIELANKENDGVGAMSGNTTLSEGSYTLDLVCETPFGVKGPEKSYEIDVVKEDFSINLENLKSKSEGVEIDVDNSPILIPMQLLNSDNSSEFELQFTTNYQDDLNCSVDTTQSGIAEFITSFFVNTQTDAYSYPQQKGLFEASIEIDSSTSSIDISCTKANYNSGDYNFPIEIFDSSTYEVDDIQVVGER